MARLEKVNKMISDILSEGKQTVDKKRRKALAKELKFLTKIRNYLELGLPDCALEKQLNSNQTLIEKTWKHYDTWVSWNKDKEKPMVEFGKKFINPLKNQIEVIEYILNIKP